LPLAAIVAKLRHSARGGDWSPRRHDRS